MGEQSANRPTPAANGKLAKTPFVHLLLYALEKKLDGTIELLAPDRRSASVVFARGEPTKVRTSEAVAYLGEVLHEMGFVDRGRLDRSLAELSKQKAAGAARLHGALLLGMGVIQAGQLRAGLAEQTVRKLRVVAAMPAETTYDYYDAFDALQTWGGADSPNVDPVPHLWGMLREYTPWEHVTAALGRVASSPLRLARGAELGRLHLAAEEAAAVDLLRVKPLRASELASVARLNERTAQLLAYLLLITKQVEVLPAAEGASDGRISALPPIATKPPSVVVKTAPVATKPSSVPRIPPVKPSPLPLITARRSAPPGGRISSVPPAPSTLSSELAERWTEIGARAATIDRADYFMMLDVARDATREEVEAAFFGLAKRWHPDRLPPELAPVREACSRVFSRMSEAHKTLSDDEARARYMKLVAEGSGSPEMQEQVARVVEAAQNFQKAEVFLKRNDLAQAEIYCRRAFEGDATQPDYLATHAWLLAQRPENASADKTLESIRMLDKAVSMSDRCEKAFFWRGMLYKRLGKSDLAAKDFRQVVELNPRNIDAAREVRLHGMRGGRGSSPSPPKTRTPAPKHDDQKGLFGRFFKNEKK
jgi:curved DNA-binding protein CbpA